MSLQTTYEFYTLSLLRNAATGLKCCNKYSDVFDNLLDNNFNSENPVQFGQGNVLDGSLQPLESGIANSAQLALPKKSENVTYFIALRATNNRNVASNTSNVVSVKIVFVQQPETQPPTTRPTVTPIMYPLRHNQIHQHPLGLLRQQPQLVYFVKRYSIVFNDENVG